MEIEPIVVCHGGSDSRAAYEDGCRRAAEKGLKFINRGVAALDAVVEAAAVLEDDPRFNAGTGAVLRLDGKTIELDAAVMDSMGRLGAVVALRGAKNPVRVARRVADTPHVMLAGEGARLFAQRCGLDAVVEPTPEALARHQRLHETWARSKWNHLESPWTVPGLKEAWNFPEPLERALGCDTIGAVARDADGRFAAATSTGGTAWMLMGRVGDSPIAGSGYWAGPAGAVAATGTGEEIVRRQLSKTVYDWIAQGKSCAVACHQALALFPESVSVGLIAVSLTDHAWASNREMPAAAAQR